MASGGPGDHWRTDLFQWGLAPFGEPIDGLIRDIERYGGVHLLGEDQDLGRRLRRLWSDRGLFDASRPKDLIKELRQTRDRLRKEAIQRGWDVD